MSKCANCEGLGLVRANRMVGGKYQFRKIPCRCAKGARLEREQLREQVRILREALTKFADFPVDGNDNECAWKALDQIEHEAKAALEATKEL